jgi:hypothetical protein
VPTGRFALNHIVVTATLYTLRITKQLFGANWHHYFNRYMPIFFYSARVAGGVQAQLSLTAAQFVPLASPCAMNTPYIDSIIA